MNSIDRVQRLTLADAAAEKLRALIGEGSLAPGERLTEAELSGRLGISRIPVYDDYLRRFGGDPDAGLHATK